MNDTVDIVDVQSYKDGEGDGPDPENLRLDLLGGSKSIWNQRVFHILLEKLKEEVEDILPEKSDAYFLAMFHDRYKRLSDVWRRAQPRTAADGAEETLEEVETRMTEARELRTKRSRQLTRRRNVSG